MDVGVPKTKLEFECRGLDGNLAYATALLVHHINFDRDCNAYCVVVD